MAKQVPSVEHGRVILVRGKAYAGLTIRPRSAAINNRQPDLQGMGSELMSCKGY
jgi:hypothetical protein